MKLPTAYMMPPHVTSWRICSVFPVLASWGVPAAGVRDTGPVCAEAAPASHSVLSESAPAAAIVLVPLLRCHLASPSAGFYLGAQPE